MPTPRAPKAIGNMQPPNTKVLTANTNNMARGECISIADVEALLLLKSTKRFPICK